ncbi:TPA: hypothetical protein EYP66_12345 [Candidatus Poribacteria bacterium]|nr:hypothetical protein [Candidatus Poribacteria bacterium]
MKVKVVFIFTSLIFTANLYLSFEEGKGNIAHDISGNENRGDINKTVWVKEGKYDSALEFTGAPDSYVRIKRAKSLIPKDRVTLEAWVFTLTKQIEHAKLNGEILKRSDETSSKPPKA